MNTYRFQTTGLPLPGSFFLALLVCVLLAGCSSLGGLFSRRVAAQRACQATEPAWVKPDPDPAVEGTPDYGYYYVNADSSIWAVAWWFEQDDPFLHAGGEGYKVGWLRPAGAAIEITGKRLDAEAPPLEVELPCCYPTRFQPSGLYFPTEGCWEVSAKAGQSALSFTLWVEPEKP